MDNQLSESFSINQLKNITVNPPIYKVYDDIISKYIVSKEKEAKSLLARLNRAQISALKRQSPEEQKKTTKK